MGTMIKRGAALRAVVRLKGETKTKTFERTKEGTALARRWIIEQEAGIIATGATKSGFTIAGVLEKMRLKELEKPYPTPTPTMFATLAAEFGPVDLSKLTAEWWVERAKAWDVTPCTRLTKLTRVFGALKRAQILFGCAVRWDEIKRAKAMLAEDDLTGKSKARERRISDEEIAAIKAQIGLATLTQAPLADIIDFAVLTGLRRAEILRITWEDLNTVKGHPMLWVRDRKAPKGKVGNHQNIPLLGGADKIVKRQSRKPGSPYIFPFEEHMITRHFRQCCIGARVKDAHFHDLRHEAISRLFEAGYSIPEVCGVSGHKSWECLKIYTNLNSADMHKGPAARRAA
jgi:integrase